jgi:hypothetical protein
VTDAAAISLDPGREGVAHAENDPHAGDESGRMVTLN